MTNFQEWATILSPEETSLLTAQLGVEALTAEAIAAAIGAQIGIDLSIVLFSGPNREGRTSFNILDTTHVIIGSLELGTPGPFGQSVFVSDFPGLSPLLAPAAAQFFNLDTK